MGASVGVRSTRPDIGSRVGGFLYLLPSTSQFVEDLVYDDDNRFTALLTCSLVGR